MQHRVTHRFVSTIATLLLISSILASQVRIKERVEIKPKVQKQAHTAAIYDFFSPPLFVNINGQPALTLGSSLTMTGTVTVNGDIGANQQADVMYIGRYENNIAWQGRTTPGSGGVPYSGTAPYTDTFSPGTYPNIQLYLMDVYGWSNGARQVATSSDAVDYTFNGTLHQGPLVPDVPVQATAHATGSVLSSAAFQSWQVEAYPEALTCAGISTIDLAPLDGSNQLYDPVGKDMMSGM